MLCAGVFLFLEQVDGWEKIRGCLVPAVLSAWDQKEPLAKFLLLFIENLEHLVDISGLVPLFCKRWDLA